MVVFDDRLFRNDKKTPICETLNMATVRCWYGKETKLGRCKSLIDVEFDHRPGFISRGHFTFGVRVVSTREQAEQVVGDCSRNAQLTADQEFRFRQKLFAGLRE